MHKFFIIAVFIAIFCIPNFTNAAMINLEAFLKIKINAIGGDDMFIFSLKPEYYNSWEDYDFPIFTANGIAESDQEVIYPIQYHYLDYQTPPGWELVSHSCTSDNPYNTFVDCLRGLQIRMLDFTHATCEYTFQKKQTRNPVLIIPGIMGSYLERASDGKELWPNIGEMITSPSDSFMDELKMDENGISENNINTGDIIRKAAISDVYDGLIKELEGAGYIEGTNLFVLPYDWRQDIAISADVTLKNKIEQLKNITGKVDVVAHSMGGLLLKKYIYDFGSGSIGKFIDLATPHLGSPKISKVLLFGDDLGITLGFLGANQNTVKNISRNMMSNYELLPSIKYLTLSNTDYRNYLYNESYLFNPPYLPQANMNYDDSIFYLGSSGLNENLLENNKFLHNQIDDLSYDNSYNIVGCGLATIGKIWFKGKDKNGNDKYDLTYINGDGTVPLRSATYFHEPISFAREEHGGISAASGVKELVASILKGEESNFNFGSHSNLSRTESVCSFNGYQVSFHSPIELNITLADGRHIGPNADGNIENNIDGASYDVLGDNKFAFVPAGASFTISGQAESSGEFDLRVKKIVNGQYAESILFYNLALSSAKSEIRVDLSEIGILSALQYDAEGDGVFEKTISPSAVLNADQQNDAMPPITTIKLSGEEIATSTYMLAADIGLSGDDSDGSGVLDIYFRLDDCEWQKYSSDVIMTVIGSHTIEYYAVDKAGNEEETKKVEFAIIAPTPEYLLNKIIKLSQLSEIYSSAVISYFTAQLRLVINKERSKSNCDEYFRKKYKEMLKQLELYNSKNWLSQSAYDIIKIRINFIIKIL
jgi:hypothetical protein